jgi:hypothetical protein
MASVILAMTRQETRFSKISAGFDPISTPEHLNT